MTNSEKNRSDRLRTWLERNKVFFEVLAGSVAVVLIGIMAVVVSHRANQIAAVQTELAERQTQLLEVELSPNVLVTYEWKSEEEGSEASYDLFISLSNAGGPLGDLRVFHEEYLCIESASRQIMARVEEILEESGEETRAFLLGLESGTPRREALYFPVNYLLTLGWTGDPTGKLCELAPRPSQNRTYGTLRREFKDWVEARLCEEGTDVRFLWQWPRIFLLVHIEVTYENRMGNLCREDFCIHQLRGVQRMRGKGSEEVHKELEEGFYTTGTIVYKSIVYELRDLLGLETEDMAALSYAELQTYEPLLDRATPTQLWSMYEKYWDLTESRE
ncbi:hypothetical protein KAX17_06160 [Candidatus Bipolaricaulota bacterium]|nr:hypothetical protein [Candidatus Bipolaricaulota bacterium]